MEIIIDYNKFQDCLSAFIDPYEIPGAEMAIDKSRNGEVVRCKECVYTDMFWPGDRDIKNTYHCKMLDAITTDIFFCAYGERRTDDEA